MAKKNGGGMIHTDVHNAVDNKNPETPDSNGEDLYFGGYNQVLANHLKETGNMFESPNSKASRDMYGGPAAGEPNPVGQGGNGRGKGK